MKAFPHRRRSRLPAVLAAAAAALLVITGITACGNSTPRNLLDSIKSGHVVLGAKYDQPGLGVREPDKDVVGFDVTVSEWVVKQIAKDNGWPEPQITYKETPSALREKMIENGEVDMIAATYSISAARAKKVAFAGPYLLTYQALLVRADDDSLTQLTDLAKGRKLCSVSGSTSAINVKSALGDVQLQEFDTYSSCVEAVRRGKVDALTTDATILAGFANRYPGEFKLVPMTYPTDTCINKTLRKAGAPFSKERYGIGMNLQNKPSVDAVNKALRQMTLGAGYADTVTTEADFAKVAYANDDNPLFTALREALGKDADTMIADGKKPDTKNPMLAYPGDLAFLTSTSTPCEGAAK